PDDYESSALPTELRRPTEILNCVHSFVKTATCSTRPAPRKVRVFRRPDSHHTKCSVPSGPKRTEPALGKRFPPFPPMIRDLHRPCTTLLLRPNFGGNGGKRLPSAGSVRLGPLG